MRYPTKISNLSSCQLDWNCDKESQAEVLLLSVQAKGISCVGKEKDHTVRASCSFGIRASLCSLGGLMGYALFCGSNKMWVELMCATIIHLVPQLWFPVHFGCWFPSCLWTLLPYHFPIKELPFHCPLLRMNLIVVLDSCSLIVKLDMS